MRRIKMATDDETKDKSFAEAWKQPGTTVLPILVVESKDIAEAAFESMPRETYEAYIAKKSAVATATQIFAELDLKLITRLHKISDLKKDNPNTIWCIKEKDYNAIKKKHGVKVD